MKRATLAIAVLAVAGMIGFGLPASAGHILGCPHRPTNYEGTAGDDCASDGDGSNDLWGLKGGNDEAFGDNGGDIIDGWGGNDSIQGGNGPDWLIGGDGHDNLYEFEPGQGGLDSDRVNGEGGNDFIECGRGADTCLGGTQTVGGEDVIFHCHDVQADNQVGGFEEHIDVFPPNC
jgi:Ca2+-binding RTX toxin-like protein